VIALRTLAAIVTGGACLHAGSAVAQTVAPPAVQAIDITERLGAPITLDVPFTDDVGRKMTLREAFHGGAGANTEYDGKPVVLVLAYYRCPQLCGLVLRGVATALIELDYDIGDEYRIVTVSFDPRDTQAAAREAKRRLLHDIDRDRWDAKWPFLRGGEDDVRRLADELGFGYAYDPATDQYAHAAAFFVLTGDGRIMRYLYGVDFRPKDVKLAILEAGEGRVGSFVDKIILSCYRYDPSSRRYGPWIEGFFRIGALVIFVCVGGVIGVLAWRDHRRSSADEEIS
jgi:protein SCO1/2